MALIACDKLALTYDGKLAVKNVSFKLNSGDYLCIVGENGSGKSTLVKGLLGLIPPSSGSISFSGDLKQNEIGYLPQQTVIQRDFPASVYEVVLSGCLGDKGLFAFYTKEDKEKVAKNMELLEISKLKNKCYRDLSGGQQQRVLLARALCATKKLMLLDEPVTGLDPLSSAGMYEFIYKLNKDEGISVIMVSHDINQAVEYANLILHISTSPLFFGKTADYLLSDAGKTYLGGMAHA